MRSVRPKKSLGQHFLHDARVIANIADAIPVLPGIKVIEIGPGTGALTRELVERFDHVTAVEIDRRVMSGLKEAFPSLELIHGDVLKMEWAPLLNHDGPICVVGNLPYYITSQILFSVLAQRRALSTALFMMQREVAERLVAEPGTKAYGILSVQTQLMSRPEKLFDVGPDSFDPPPSVTSSVIRLHFDRPELSCSDEGLKRVVRTAFQQRRKKLSNSLSALDPLPEDPEFDYSLRAERWPPPLYEKLTARLEQDGTNA